ncbi:Acyl carrier protein (ACP2) [Enhygromyxa salina]|uniref:Acyl carrier protein (ACP2) n=1 Tax=Enhygromyxa salina TaxID=215803 RepID=A0A0C2CXX6_9BACT|nr:acyl carrier protein [Enhygromyxa salina]KIG15851.1 Acyl carrier protein (ACP2) [Enhygromyxa salina]
MTPEQILAYLRQTIAELFELDAEQVHAESTVFDELDLDSIDAMDLVAKLQQFTGQRIEEDAMRGVRTVGDIAALLAAQLAGGRSPGVPDASATS